MAGCALPAVLLMNAGRLSSSAAAGVTGAAAEVLPQLQWVWSGLLLVMALRAVTIGVPYAAQLPPFTAFARGSQQQPKQA
jgi:hypothetical protein